MSSREANIEQLNLAITTLNEDAENMHGLIVRSAGGLESATEASNRAADNAAKIIEALGPLTETLDTQHRNSTAMLEEARKASEDQRAAAAEQVENLKSAVEKALESVSTKTDATCLGLVNTFESAYKGFKNAQTESFDDIKAKNLKEHEKTRDELQTDILGFKNATSARMDALEAELAKSQNALKELGSQVAESTNAASKKLLIPLYVAIGLGIINLICLVMLLVK